MRQFVLTTTSESSDHYIHFIEHEEVPTRDEILTFLRTKGSDFDESQTYESVDELVEITPEKFKTIL